MYTYHLAVRGAILCPTYKVQRRTNLTYSPYQLIYFSLYRIKCLFNVWKKIVG
jgi:hypothetical protein